MKQAMISLIAVALAMVIFVFPSTLAEATDYNRLPTDAATTTIELSLPFALTDELPDSIMSMGETIAHDPPTGHPGIDYQWDNPSPVPTIRASMDGVVTAINANTYWIGKWDVATQNGIWGVDYTELDSVNPNLKVGDTVKAGDYIGHPQHPSNVTSNPNYRMIHWQFGFANPDSSNNGGLVGIRLCPMPYFTDEARQTIEQLWADTPDSAVKQNAPEICSNFYAQEPKPFIVTGTKAGVPTVQVLDPTGRLFSSFRAYASNMTSGFNVAVGDINGDGQSEIITVPRTGAAPHVRIFDVNGNNLGWDFFAYDTGFRGGVNLAVGDIEGDGPMEIITSPMANGGPNVRVFGLRGSSVVPTTENFMAYDKNFRGGIAVSIGDIEGDGIGDIITTPTSRGGPHVRVFGVRDRRYVPVTLGVMAYADSFRGGINSCVGDVDGDGWDEIITGIVSAGGPHVRILGVPGLRQGVSLESPGFMAYATDYRGGVQVTSIDINDDGTDEIITAMGSNGNAIIRFYDAQGNVVTDLGNNQATNEFTTYATSFQDGITIASGFFAL